MSKVDLLDQRVNALEDAYKSLDEKIDKIMENHLPHIQQDIVWIKVIGGLNVVGIIGAIVTIIRFVK